MSVCLCVCRFVPKDLANRWTDRVFLNRVDSHRSREGLQLFWGRVPPPSYEKLQKIEIFWIFCFYLETSTQHRKNLTKSVNSIILFEKKLVLLEASGAYPIVKHIRVINYQSTTSKRKKNREALLRTDQSPHKRVASLLTIQLLCAWKHIMLGIKMFSWIKLYFV